MNKNIKRKKVNKDISDEREEKGKMLKEKKLNKKGTEQKQKMKVFCRFFCALK